MSGSDYSDDKKIRKIDSDILKFKQELQQAESEQAGIGARLDGEIERLRTDAKTKLDAYEAIRKRAREAEASWKEADKKYKKASGGKNAEISNTRKKVEGLKKRIKNAEKTKLKRIDEIEKGKMKIVEKAKKQKAKEMEKIKADEVGKVEEEKKRELGID
ncbi:MAG: hypothetical protein JW779_08735 [Candidatus Thorarchaeota archaeon]|nr:hypothetical protein [Candidatus Thorarchaeota archaeon]